jgi:hypothetical protein
MYANYNEDDNGGINNFHANIISGRVYLTF